MQRVPDYPTTRGYPAIFWPTRTRPDPTFHYPALPDTRPITRGYPTGNKMTKNNGKNGKICQIFPKKLVQFSSNHLAPLKKVVKRVIFLQT